MEKSNNSSHNHDQGKQLRISVNYEYANFVSISTQGREIRVAFGENIIGETDVRAKFGIVLDLEIAKKFVDILSTSIGKAELGLSPLVTVSKLN